jgi:fatty-acyl-CoA synthase
MLAHPSLPQRRLMLRGGWAAASDETMRRIDREMGAAEMVNAYGLSEASPNVVISDHTDPLDVRASGLALPHPGMELRICDAESGKPLPAGAIGELQVRGWSVMQGYYKRPDATAAALDAEGWLHTGDLGRLTDEGRFQFIGRLKDVFRVGGENVAPMEVETVLQKHPAVEFAQVVGVPDARLGEVPAAFVTLRAGQRAAPEELIAFCKERCANFKVPRYLDIVESFEAIGMTGSSKVQKNKLRDYAIARFDLAAALAPGTAGS